MKTKTEVLELEIPKEVIEHAKKEGISIECFKGNLGSYSQSLLDLL